MSQNRSSAVMQQRSEPHDSLDDFPTPPWATRAVLWQLEQLGHDLGDKSVREPCANRGFMVRPLSETFGAVFASDVHDYGYGYSVRDYLFGPENQWDRTDWTFLNPPFRLAEAFIERALALSRIGVVAIVRGAFAEGVGRYGRLYSVRPPSFEFQFVERVPMVKGRYDPDASTATSYIAMLWQTADAIPADTRKRWIPPCRKRFERPEDVEPFGKTL